MSDINRALIVVKPKQAFLDWARTLEEDEQVTLEELRQDCTAYLIPEYESDDDQIKILEACHDYLFDMELGSWDTNQESWPEQRDLEAFLEWFDVEFPSLVFDLVGTPIDIVDYEVSEDDASSNGH